MERFLTLTFITPLTAAQMYARLRETHDWNWMDRDGDRWGDYLSSSAIPGFPGASVSLYADEPEPGRCALNVRFRSDATDAETRFEALRRRLAATLLTSIEAQATTETEFLE